MLATEHKIYLNSHPVLRMTSNRVADVHAPEVRGTIRTMESVFSRLHAHFGQPKGLGLAAVQLGVRQRIIAVNFREERLLPYWQAQWGPAGLVVMINPELVETSEDMMDSVEGCMSVPGMIIQNVRRHAQVTVTYRDNEGQQHLMTATGWLSSVLQHEIDHLNGSLFLDKIPTGDLRNDFARDPFSNPHIRARADARVIEEEIRARGGASGMEGIGYVCGPSYLEAPQLQGALDVAPIPEEAIGNFLATRT